MEENFFEFWESTIQSGTSPELVIKWREHELTAIERGHFIVSEITIIRKIKGIKLLDIGCGYGGPSIAFCEAGAQVIGIDSNCQNLKGANIRIRYDHPVMHVCLAQSLAEHLPFQDNSFDMVICNDVLEHVRSHVQTINEIARVLKPLGNAYFQFPNYFSFNNFLRDPHFNIPVASIMPPLLGQFLVVKVLKRNKNYGVGWFPIASRIFQLLRNNGIDIIYWKPSPKRKIWILTPLLRMYRFNSVPLVTLLCQKQINE